jgi:curved DNA-binding protein
MPVTFKDYYQTLGLARAATAEDIRRAFRKLAREYHPDVAQDKITAEVKFKEINEAYEVLGDPGKRRQYDSLGTGWNSSREFRRSNESFQNSHTRSNGRSNRGRDFDSQFGRGGFSDFFEHIFGSNTEGQPSSNKTSGSGTSDRAKTPDSEILVSLQEVLKGSLRPITIERRRCCQECHGARKINHRPCSICQGEGEVRHVEKYQVKIPPGVREGQRLRIPAQRGNGGDLYLRIRLESHADLRVEGTDLRCEFGIAPWEAVLGANVSISTLEGRHDLRIPAGSQTGQRLRLRGQGLPVGNGDRGDLIVALRVRVPQDVDDHERAVWERLARESRFSPRD